MERNEPPRWLQDKHFNEVLFCEDFLSAHPMVCVDGSFFTVEGRVADEEGIRKQIYEMLRPHFTSGTARRATTLLETLRLEAYTPELPIQEDRIHVANGTLFLNGEFRVEKEFCRNRLPIRYDPSAPQPVTWLRFLSDLLEPEDILTLQEYLGYCLIPTNRGQVMMLLKGNGGEGKSRIGVVMQKLLGGNMKNGSIAKVERSPFARADLEHELLKENVHQHRAVKLRLLLGGSKRGKGGENDSGDSRCAGQDGGVEDDERSRAGERGIEKHSPPFPDPLAEYGPEKEQGQQQNAHRPWVHCVDSSKHRVLSFQAAHDAGQKALAPAFLRQFFFSRFAAGRNQIGKGRLTVALPEFIIAGGLLNGCKHRWVKGKRVFGCGLELQLILAAFQQAASLFTVNQDEGCALRVVGIWLNSLDAPIVRKRDVAATLDPFELTYKAGAAGVQSLDKTALIGVFGSGLGELSAVIKRGANMVRLPAICLVAEGE